MLKKFVLSDKLFSSLKQGYEERRQKDLVFLLGYLEKLGNPVKEALFEYLPTAQIDTVGTHLYLR